MYDDGYKLQLNIDISEVVIKQMIERNKDLRPDLQWKVMDITDMSTLQSQSFDLIIDKSTMDALLCGDNSFVNVAKMLKETQRLLRPGGTYFVVSYGKPDSRVSHLEHEFLSFDIRQFVVYDSEAVTAKEKDERTHYIYVCTKNPDADEKSAAHYARILADLEDENEQQKIID